MLGKLTRWLRILGYDVKYSPSFTDEQLLKIARIEHRILLSSDLALCHQAKKQGVAVIFVEGETVAEKLTTLVKQSDLKLKFDPSLSRCPKCNTKVMQIPKNRVVGRVPTGTLTHFNEFWKCLTCHQIYWQGSHWKRINQTLKETTEMS